MRTGETLPMRHPDQQLQGLSPSLGWVPLLWSVFQGPAKPLASLLGQMPLRPTPQDGGENATRQQH